MIKGNKLKTTAAFTAGFAVLCLIFLFAVPGRYARWREENSGIPDAVSSMSDGKTCRLTVVANSSAIGNKEEFARKVVEMCRENTFRSLRLSTDREGWPEKLDIRVYLKKRDIGEKEPLMQILCEPPDDEGDYDIRNDWESYHMTIRESG